MDESIEAPDPLISLPAPPASAEERKAERSLETRLAVISLLAALLGALVGGGATLWASSLANGAQLRQQEISISDSLRAESREQRTVVYRQWLDAEQAAKSAAAAWRFCGSFISMEESCETSRNTLFQKLNELSKALIEIQIFGSERATEVATHYQNLAGGWNNMKDTGTRGVRLPAPPSDSDLILLRDEFISISCFELSAEPRNTCTG
ncbi:hypothetical protein [Arthrobacter sp. lap29]|uniref:hypothetical protein n=1 Tax=Arthrobacter sp. lap29 TaxID=3056122 RepID=UPI0028F7176D|nr:hypothetical protein [Arthrobacter sp. lap29]